MRFHIKRSSYHHYACTMPVLYLYAYYACTMPIEHVLSLLYLYYAYYACTKPTTLTMPTMHIYNYREQTDFVMLIGNEYGTQILSVV